MLTTRIKENKVGKYTYLSKETLDEKGRVIRESYPVDLEGKFTGDKTQWTTFEWLYEGDNRTPSEERHRGYGQGTFWTDWEDLRD